MMLDRECPFCKSNNVAVVLAHGSGMDFVDIDGNKKKVPVLYVVRCLDCRAQTGVYESARMAREAWKGSGFAKIDKSLWGVAKIDKSL